jgi:hypothetical protein
MTRSAALLSIIAVAAVAGCGSSKSSGISPASYRSQVNALCASNNAQITALPKSDQSNLAGIEKLDSIATGTLTKVKAISPPSSISSGVNKWIAAIEQEEGLASQIINDLKAGKTSAIQALGGKASSIDAQTDSDAKSLGLSSCAADAEPSGS